MDCVRKILSVVIPTYNMEKYLCDCLDSVTREDIPSSLDLILVNDGSTDSSLEIMQKYQKKRPDIITIIDKPNGHYGSCINAGLSVAKGKYFRPLDADDWFSTNALIKILENLQYIQVDLIVTPRLYIVGSTKTLAKCHHLTNAAEYSLSNLTESEVSDLSSILTMHSLTYKTELLKENRVKLQEGICYTDVEYSILPLKSVQNFIYLDYPLYNYRLDRQGQSMDPVVYYNNRHHIFQVLIRILDEVWIEKNPVAFQKVQAMLRDYYTEILFKHLPDKQDDLNLKRIDYQLCKHFPKSKKELYRNLFYWPLIWKISGLHLYSFSFQHLKNLFHFFK